MMQSEYEKVVEVKITEQATMQTRNKQSEYKMVVEVNNIPKSKCKKLREAK